MGVSSMRVRINRFSRWGIRGPIRLSGGRYTFWILLLVLSAVGCRTTPVTERRQLLLVPEHEEVALGVAAYRETLGGEALSQNAEANRLVQRVGQRIARVADRPDYEWEFQLIASPEKNAFCLPGGKVAIYEGILPICQNEAGLAVVMSHEIAHALARHGGERMSHEYVTQGVGTALSYVLKDRETVKRDRILQAYGVASKYGFVLPYSRTHESEADHMGLMLMARAGYDPTEAPQFWQRFATSGQGSQLPEFLSTHPAGERRSLELSELLPEALQLYGDVMTRHGKGEAIPVSQAGLAGNGDSAGGAALVAHQSPVPAHPTGCQHCGP